MAERELTISAHTPQPPLLPHYSAAACPLILFTQRLLDVFPTSSMLFLSIVYPCSSANERMPPRQKYSIFLPIHRTSRAASRATSAAKDGARSPKTNGSGKNSRSSAAAQTSKRRSTMNSRDAAYDEEEQLRRAIEASKEDAIPEESDSVSTRRPKRGRDDSEECVSK